MVEKKSQNSGCLWKGGTGPDWEGVWGNISQDDGIVYTLTEICILSVYASPKLKQ